MTTAFEFNGNTFVPRPFIVKSFKETWDRQTLIDRNNLDVCNANHHGFSIYKVLLDFGQHLRTTVPLVSYIRNSLRFWYYASLSTCCQNLDKKIGVTRKIWEKAGVKRLRDLTGKSVNLSTLATSNIRLLLVFGEEDQ